MKILLPLDFSENSKKALDFIVSLSNPKVTTITLIHVVELVYDFASQAALALDSLHREAESMFKKTIEKYQSTGIKFDYLILEGTASITIARTALELKSDLIVMGTQGASGIKKALIGSTAVNTIKEAKTPVLVIPSESNIAKLKKITLALEIADHEQMHIDWVKRLSESWKLDLEFLHIQSGSSFRENILLLGLEAHLSKNYPNYPVKVRSYFAPNPKEGFDQFLQENKNGILVMCHEHKNLLDQILSKSQSIQMAYHSQMPLLVIT